MTPEHARQLLLLVEINALLQSQITALHRVLERLTARHYSAAVLTQIRTEIARCASSAATMREMLQGMAAARLDDDSL